MKPKPVVRKLKSGPKSPRGIKAKAPVTIGTMSPNTRKAMQSICKTHGTTLGQIPVWLLGKSTRRLEYWFKTGK